jgi:hypothetical protein
LHSELDAGVRSAARYMVEKAVADWLDEGLPGQAAQTVEVNRDWLAASYGRARQALPWPFAPGDQLVNPVWRRRCGRSATGCGGCPGRRAA